MRKSRMEHGRIERLNGTFQDRLCADLQRNKITTIESANESANEFLWNYFLPRYNKRFTITPANATNAHIPVHETYDIEKVFAYSDTRRLCNDNTIKFHTKSYQIIPSRNLKIPPKATIICRTYLDNSLKVFYDTVELKYKELKDNVYY